MQGWRPCERQPAAKPLVAWQRAQVGDDVLRLTKPEAHVATHTNDPRTMEMR